MNEATITGRFTKDPVLRKTKSGKSVCNFDLAVRRNFKNNSETDDGRPNVDFIRCVAWEKNAELIAQYCRKGRSILVRGSFHTNKNTSQKDGKTYSNTELSVSNFEFMDGSNKNNKPDASNPSGSFTTPVDSIPKENISDSDIPF